MHVHARAPPTRMTNRRRLPLSFPPVPSPQSAASPQDGDAGTAWAHHTRPFWPLAGRFSHPPALAPDRRAKRQAPRGACPPRAKRDVQGAIRQGGRRRGAARSGTQLNCGKARTSPPLCVLRQVAALASAECLYRVTERPALQLAWGVGAPGTRCGLAAATAIDRRA
jgi:hypothetical protein